MTLNVIYQMRGCEERRESLFKVPLIPSSFQAWVFSFLLILSGILLLPIIPSTTLNLGIPSTEAGTSSFDDCCVVRLRRIDSPANCLFTVTVAQG
ncbi:hypothetical protein BO83DRAFT_98700 [Aspergillus eucalypticola CBS 122712]|uniref:Uncharacterized protein n=1 Tax=Aspergillus eucalypticola (strain CBS 122712 / IBT 29274) TaxID=1448314 RepID=A0A317UZ80_ASPEC|nr:uncharacterized protein BO83DRAFT_98700 [Aspergillus eucalypticola CBS 122712]PWY67374.1 hypothetical protein BO83DRAFT_98700 [Aspergillus eucalypticola CBS 122712]